MSEHNGNCRKGRMIWIVAGILTLISVIVFQTVRSVFLPVTILMAASVIITAAGLFAEKKHLAPDIVNFIPVITAALNAFATVYAFFLMVDKIIYVVTALEPISTIYTFIAYEILIILSLILHIIVSFSGISGGKTND